MWDHDLGEVFGAAVDVRLSPHNIVQPDVCFISRARLGIEREQYVDGAPDLVIEVLSERTRGVDLVRKRALYEMAGVPEYWIVDLRNRTITVLTLVEGDYRVIGTDDGSARSLVVPGFEVNVAEAFASLRDDA